MIGNTFLLDGWAVDVAGGRMTRGGKDLRLEPQVMKVLVYLAERPGSVVSREELFEKLWDQSFVGDAALTRCIFEIRQAFGDTARDSRIIETVPKKGFRLVAAPCALATRKTLPDSMLAWATAAALLLAVLVLPLGDRQSASSGLPATSSPVVETYDKALRHLAQPTRVANRNAIAMFERSIDLDPGFGLGHAGLANALSQQAIYWGGDQLDLAHDAAITALELSPDSPRSHNAFGMVQLARGEYAAALAAFATATRLDPNFVDAIYNAADVHRLQLEFGKAADFYAAVLNIDPQHGAAMNRLGFLHLRRGDVANARLWLERVIENVPLDAYANAQLATLELVVGNTATALDICGRVNDLYPTYRACLHILADGNLALGNYDEARRWFEYEIASHEVSYRARLGIAHVLIATQRVDEGMAIANELLEHFVESASRSDADWGDYWMVAASLTLKGDTEQALVWLDKAAEAGRRFALRDEAHFAFDALRHDQRFGQYVSKTMLASNN